MTEKQLRYIDKLCSQSICIGKYIIKPDLMKEKMLTFNQELTQLFIDLGKAWKEWHFCDYAISKYEYAEDHYYASYYEEIAETEKEQERAWKKIKKIEKQIEIELDKLNFGSYYNNLLN